MLTHIHIRDFAIVQELELALGAGMTVLTGETGAGKSILVDALGLALGDRGDSSVIRHGAERAEISVSFDVEKIPAARRWLEEQELDADGECHLRRTINRDGRSKGFINGRPQPLQSLRELGELLVDIHGQHEHQSLLRRDAQRQLLDDYAGHDDLITAVEQHFRRWKELNRELEELRRAADERQAQLDLLRYQVQELEALGLEPDEVAELEAEHSRLANAERLLDACRNAMVTLYEDEELSVDNLLSRALSDLDTLRHIDPRLAAACELLESTRIQVREGVEELRRYSDHVEVDPARLQWVEQRIATIHDLSRKHRVAPEELHPLLEQLQKKLAGLEQADMRFEELEREVATAAQDYREQAQRLSESRARAAKKLSQGVTSLMQQLGMPGGRYQIVLEPADPAQFSASGMDRIEFLVSANPGHPLRPLNKVASGGELSRISLAIQVMTARSGRIPTLVFDEVDVGIGGGVAETVGRQLHTLAASRQVLCVTHLPQVAAQAHHHLQVSKRAAQNTTHTGIRGLTPDERVQEIARMLGGIEITEQTVAHAREMMERAGNRPEGA